MGVWAGTCCFGRCSRTGSRWHSFREMQLISPDTDTAISQLSLSQDKLSGQLWKCLSNGSSSEGLSHPFPWPRQQAAELVLARESKPGRSGAATGAAGGRKQVRPGKETDCTCKPDAGHAHQEDKHFNQMLQTPNTQHPAYRHGLPIKSTTNAVSLWGGICLF